jgi:hypothetical protein
VTYLWQYWETRRPPSGCVAACLETVERQAAGFERVVVDERSVYDWLPGLDDRWERLSRPAHRADYLRARLLARYGGLWLDADAIALKPLRELHELAHGAELLCWVNVDGAVAVNLLHAVPGAATVRSWAVEQDRLLAAADGDGPIAVAWNALGSDVLTPVARDPSKSVHFLPRSRVAPLSWHDADRFLKPAHRLRSLLRDDPVVVMLYNEILDASIGHLSRDEVLAADTLLAALLRIALGDEARPRHRFGLL